MLTVLIDGQVNQLTFNVWQLLYVKGRGARSASVTIYCPETGLSPEATLSVPR